MFKNNKKTKISIIIIFFILISITFLILKSCSLRSIFSSMEYLGRSFTLSSCKSSISFNSKVSLKKIVKDSYFENKLRSFSDKGTYFNINKNNFEKLKKISIENKILVKKIPNTVNGEIDLINNDNSSDILFEKRSIKEFNSWKRSHGGNKNLKYLDSNYLNKDNVDKIELLWKVKIDKKFGWKRNVQNNPVYIDKTLIYTSADNQIIAVDARNGNIKWNIHSVGVPALRGLVLDKTIKDTFLYIPIDSSIFKLNLKNGKRDKSFGLNGRVDYNTKVAPVIYNEMLCASSFNNIKCFNKTNGKALFKVFIHPKKKEFYKGGSVWGGIALDEEEGVIYVTTGNPRPAMIGINREGSNKNANSIVAISLKDRKIVWANQDVLHDLWDMDVATPPVLIDIKIKDKFYKSVIAVGKTGNLHIINRLTGKYLFDLDYSEVPKSTIPGEIASHYQLKLKNPKPLINIAFEEKNFKNKDDKDIYNYGWYEPPKFGKYTLLNGLHGGATWPGFSSNPNKNLVFIPVNTNPFKFKIEGKTLSNKTIDHEFLELYNTKCASCHMKNRSGTYDADLLKFANKNGLEVLENYVPSLVGHSILNDDFDSFLSIKNIRSHHNNIELSKKDLEGLKDLFKKWDKKIIQESGISLKYHWAEFLDENLLPNSKPPWSEIIAINLTNGKEVWRSKIGEIDNDIVGTPMYGGMVSNNDLIVATGTADNKVYFLDQENGEILKKITMEASGSAPPLIYSINGKDQISIVATGGVFTKFKREGNFLYTYGLK